MHRYLREVDCSRHISLSNIPLIKTRALVVGTKQSKQARLPCQPASQPACLLYCVPATGACTSKWFFAAATNVSNINNKIGSIRH